MIEIEVEMDSDVLAAEEVRNTVGAITPKSISCHDLSKENNSNKVIFGTGKCSRTDTADHGTRKS